MRTILRPGWLIDGNGTAPQREQSVIVHNDRIDFVGPSHQLTPDPSDVVVDLPDDTLLPGLINNHVHLVLPGDNTPFTPWIDLQSDASLALLAAHNAGTSLKAGVTAVRDCGGRRQIVLDVRNAQATGQVQGARIISCGWTITITGGHTRHFGGEVDGEENLRQMVRKLVSVGADYIKVMASGGGTPGTFAQYPSFSAAELRAIVETAHGFGKKVSTHCTCAAAIMNAVEAGVDHIEHGMFYGDDHLPQFEHAVAETLADAAIAVTPTLQVDRDMYEILPDGPEKESWYRRNQVHREGVATMRELGVPLLAGSDAGWRATAFDTFWKELDELAHCGLSAVEVVHAATGAISDLFGYGGDLGRIEAGKIADLVVVAGDLSNDIGRLKSVKQVYQSGKPVHINRAEIAEQR